MTGPSPWVDGNNGRWAVAKEHADVATVAEETTTISGLPGDEAAMAAKMEGMQQL
jgi:hypothetical protein